MASYFSSWLGTSTEEKAPVAHLSPEDAACYADWGVTLTEEVVLVRQLRDEIEMELGRPLEPMWDDYVLRRFLRARKHDIVKAKEMFIAQLEWRKANDVDSALDYDFPEKEEFHKYYPEGFYGVDRAGRPVYLQLPGKIDTEALWRFTTLDRAIRYHIKQQERYWRFIAPAASVAAGTKLEASLVLIDMDGRPAAGGEPSSTQQPAPDAAPAAAGPPGSVQPEQQGQEQGQGHLPRALSGDSTHGDDEAHGHRSLSVSAGLRRLSSAAAHLVETVRHRRSGGVGVGSGDVSPALSPGLSPALSPAVSPRAASSSGKQGKQHWWNRKGKGGRGRRESPEAQQSQQQQQHRRQRGPGSNSIGGSNFRVPGLRGVCTSQSLLLMDFSGVGISTITGEVRKIMAQVMQIDQDNYPELMHRCLIINAPTTFRVIWGMVKYLLDARTQAKIEVLPSDYKDELLKYIAPEQLAKQYGGTCAEPLMAEPGPWRDPEVLKRVKQQQEQPVPLEEAMKRLGVGESGGGKPAAAEQQQPVSVAAEAAA